MSSVIDTYLQSELTETVINQYRILEIPLHQYLTTQLYIHVHVV